MKDPLLTGRKKSQKVYRHHTGYAGGLKEIPFRQMLERKPDQILVRALMGMLPKNHLRVDCIKQNVIMFNEPFHHFGNILP
jgi:large subunit ribosomal protein L13